MRKIITVLFLSSLLLACGTPKTTAKKNASSPKKNIVSAETKQLFHNAMHGYIISDYDLALKEANAYIAKNPSDDAVYYLLSKVYFEKKDSVGSIRMLEKAKELDKTNRWYNDYLGYAYLQNKDYGKALESYQFLTKELPDEIEYHYQLLQTYYGLKQFQKSIETLDVIETRIGKSPQTSYQRYIIYINLKKYDLAEKTLVESIEEYPDEHETLFALDDFYAARKQPEKMVGFLENLISKHPTAGGASLLLAEYYLKQNKIDKAETLLLKTFSNPSVDPTYKQYFLMDNFVEKPVLPAKLAKDLALEVLKLSPSDGFIHLFLGNLSDSEGDTAKALEYYKQSVALNKNNKETLTRICVLEYQSQQYEDLTKSAQQALSLFPTEPAFYYFSAISLLKQKKLDECLDMVDNGLVYTTDNAGKEDLTSIQAEAYFGKKDFKKGKEIYEQLIKDNPKDVFLKNNLALALAKNKIDLDYADKLINQITELDPRNQNYQFTKGFILFQKGKYPEAQNIIEPILVRNPQDASLHNLIGNIFAKNGDMEKAVEYWLKAKELGYKNNVLDKKINDKKYYEDVE